MVDRQLDNEDLLELGIESDQKPNCYVWLNKEQIKTLINHLQSVLNENKTV